VPEANHEQLGRDILSPRRDLNLRSPENEAGVLHTRLRRSVEGYTFLLSIRMVPGSNEVMTVFICCFHLSLRWLICWNSISRQTTTTSVVFPSDSVTVLPFYCFAWLPKLVKSGRLFGSCFIFRFEGPGRFVSLGEMLG
jgi:hypothetical protein